MNSSQQRNLTSSNGHTDRHPHFPGFRVRANGHPNFHFWRIILTLEERSASFGLAKCENFTIRQWSSWNIFPDSWQSPRVRTVWRVVLIQQISTAPRRMLSKGWYSYQVLMAKLLCCRFILNLLNRNIHMAAWYNKSASLHPYAADSRNGYKISVAGLIDIMLSKDFTAVYSPDFDSDTSYSCDAPTNVCNATGIWPSRTPLNNTTP